MRINIAFLPFFALGAEINTPTCFRLRITARARIQARSGGTHKRTHARTHARTHVNTYICMRAGLHTQIIVMHTLAFIYMEVIRTGMRASMRIRT